MSEYQYYEFQAIDHRLNTADLTYLKTLSSRAHLTSTSASFEYNFGNFRGNELDLLEKYFDAHLYISNWGSRRLMFRFPRALIDPSIMQAYLIPYLITLQLNDHDAILDLSIEIENTEWVDTGEGWLARLIELRQAILQGDYRALYLAWLCALELNPPDKTDDNFDEGDSGYFTFQRDTPEPPVPPNLRQIGVDDALTAFMEFFQLDPLLVEAASVASPSMSEKPEPLKQWIDALPEQDCRQLLLRVAESEPNISATVLSFLRKRFVTSTGTAPIHSPRTAAELLETARELEQHKLEEQRRHAEIARQQRLERLAGHETEVWEQVIRLIKQKNAKGYDEAVQLLVQLSELADQRTQSEAFSARLEDLQLQFSTLYGLKSRLLDAGLLRKPGR